MRIQHLLTGLLMLAIPLIVTAENSTHAPGYTIHHNAFPSAILAPDIASNYKIIRSKYRGLLNISVIKEIPGTTGEAVTANIKAQARDLIGRVQTIDLREIREEKAIYYIGEFTIVDGETLDFTLEVTPAGMERPVKAQLKQQFFID